MEKDGIRDHAQSRGLGDVYKRQLVRLYEQMPEPKYVIAMGACTITGGMFSADSTTAVRGVDKLIPVDLYLPGLSLIHI